MKTQRTISKISYEHKIFAVCCTESKDFFLTQEGDAFSSTLRSNRTNSIIPIENRFVQWMPKHSAKILTETETTNIHNAIKKAERKIKKDSGVKNIVIEKYIDGYYDEILSTFKIKDKQRKELLKESERIIKNNIIDSYDDVYYGLHTVSADVIHGAAHVFQVGRTPGVLLSVPILASIDEKDAKQIAIYAALVLEVILLLGRLCGLPMSGQKAAEKIAEWLKNNKFLQALLNFINRLKADVKDITGALYEFLKSLNDMDALYPILAAGLSGALGLLGILYMILQILSWLIPGLGPIVKVAEILATGGALIVKISQL